VRKADLIIVIGTSLTVHPFASLALYPRPRALINLDRVGNFGTRKRDDEKEFLLLGQCDEIVKELCRELGWEEELMKLWEETKDSVEVAIDEKETEQKEKDEKKELQAAQDEVEKLAEKLGKQMALDKVAGNIEKKQSEATTDKEGKAEQEAVEEKIGTGVDTETKNEKGQEKEGEPQKL